MDNSTYYTIAEINYRQERVRNEWKPVRRKRLRRPHVPAVRRPLDDGGLN
jgi:hypothetical protein